MPLRFAVVCEAEADFRIATRLAERVILAEENWVEEDHVAACPLWAEHPEIGPHLRWKNVATIANRLNLPALRGDFDGRSGKPDARIARRALQLLRLLHDGEHPLDAVLLIRDSDRDTERRAGLEQARAESERRDDLRVVIGAAHCEMECWVLAGFDPEGDGEEDLLKTARQELGFDPRASAHELTAKKDGDHRSPKRVLNVLTRSDPDRKCRCWDEADLERLRERGEESGLTAFLGEIRDRLVPLFLAR